MKQIPALLLAICLIFFISSPVSAADAGGSDRFGSLTVEMYCEDTPVAGGCAVLYRVGEAVYGEDGLALSLSGDFSDSSVTPNLDMETAAVLAEYALGLDLAGMEQTVDEAGTAVFTALSSGLYLFVQTESAEGFLPAEPFLTVLPQWDEEGYHYTVFARPKLSPADPDDDAENPDNPDDNDDPNDPDSPDDGENPDDNDDPNDPDSPDDGENPDDNEDPDESGKLPQTGQLNWPVPMLALGGLFFVVLGLCLRRRGEDDHEA